MHIVNSLREIKGNVCLYDGPIKFLAHTSEVIIITYLGGWPHYLLIYDVIGRNGKGKELGSDILVLEIESFWQKPYDCV